MSTQSHARILFDIGSYDGTQFLEAATADSNVIVHAFEPHPDFFRRIFERTKGLENFHVFEKAVSDFDGTARFYVSADRPCSSLMPFDESVEEKWQPGNLKRWKRKRDFRMSGAIDVEVIRLDTFMNRMSVPYIDFLHVDAQGADLSVLRSLGERIRAVLSGCIETIVSSDKPLYRGQPSREACLEFLNTHGFEITGCEPNGAARGLEENLYFRKKGVVATG